MDSESNPDALKEPFQPPSPADAELWSRFSAAVEAGLRRVSKVVANSGYIGEHLYWPELRWRKNGLPSLSEKYHAPKDYAHALKAPIEGGSDKIEVTFRNEPAFVCLYEYAQKHPRISHHLGTPDPEKLIGDALETVLGDIIDRYVHVYDTTEFDLEKLRPLYVPVETYLLKSDLPIALIVPILFLGFEDDQIDIDERTSIIRMGDAIQLARTPHTRFSYGTHPLVESAASHALLRLGYTIPNEARVWNWYLLESAATYPVDLIDRFFAALRIATSYPTGYGQLLAMPIGWASEYAGNLQPLYKTSVRSYPPPFENSDWDGPVPTVSSLQAKDLATVFTRLNDRATHKRLSIAVRRLNSSALRMANVDKLLDIMIGLEALLSDGNQEITHKIAMRVAALYKLSGYSDPVSILKEVKDVYGYRSKIVHGGEGDLGQKVKGGRGLSITDAAADHLRTVLGVLLEYPAFLEVLEIDSAILLGVHAPSAGV